MRTSLTCERFALGVLLLAWASLAVRAEDPPASPETGKESVDVLKALDEARKSIEVLKEEVARLRKEVDELRKQPAASQSRFGSLPQTGTIRLVNTYVRSMSIIVNGTRYTLAPGETRLLRDQTPGGFTYEIPGVKGPVDRTLEVNETFTIRVFSR